MANPTIRQGETVFWTGTITNSSSSAITLTSYSFRGAIKRKPTDTAIPFTFTVPDQTLYPGKFYAQMSASTTAGITCNPYTAPNRPTTQYLGDFEIIYPTGEVYRFYEFVVEVSPEVTT